MGTTCTAAVVRGRDVYIAHVGDSRAYLVRSGRIRQLTHDHSLVGQLVRDRQLHGRAGAHRPASQRRDAQHRDQRRGRRDTEHVSQSLRNGDVLILCTDGLHGLVSDEELSAAVTHHELDQACDALITLAKKRGGPDNITMILARAESDGNGEPLATSSAERLSRAGSNRPPPSCSSPASCSCCSRSPPSDGCWCA